MSDVPDDQELLGAYLRDRSPEPMGALIERHIDFVYSTAIGQVRDPADADDVTQAVFIVLAKKPASVRGRSLPGWLFKTTRFCVANSLRAQTRRKHHERAAARPEAVMHQSNNELESLASHLDEALSGLRPDDREVILLRFTQDRDMTDIAAILGISQVSARKRLSRAVARLRDNFASRGVTLSSAGMLAGLAMTPRHASAELVTIVKAAAVLKTTSAGAAALSAKVLQSMLWFEFKIVAAVLIFSTLAGTGVAAIVWAHGSHHSQVALKTEAVKPASAPVSRAVPTVIPATRAKSAIPIPDPTENPPGRMVKVAAKLNDMGSPVLVSVPLVRDLNVVTLPADDPGTIPQITIPRGSIPLHVVLDTLQKQANIKFHPGPDEWNFGLWKNMKLVETGQPANFWDTLEDTLAQSNLRLVGYVDEPQKTLSLEPIGNHGKSTAHTAAWGQLTFTSVARDTLVVPPAWQFRDTVRLTGGQFQPDPSLIGAVVYPVQTWDNGGWHPSLGSPQAHSVGSNNYGSFDAIVPADLVQNHLIPSLRCRIPLKLVHRMHTFETELKSGDNIALSINGFVIHFFGLQQSPGHLIFSYGMIRQDGQTADQFKETLAEYESWMQELKVTVGGSPASMDSGSGRGPTGDFFVMENNWTVGPNAAGPVKLVWHLPAVVQSATMECDFKNLEVP